MKKRIVILIILIMISFSLGCGMISGEEEYSPVKLYNVKGIILDKPIEEIVLVGTSALSGEVRINPVLWQQLQPGDIVDAVITKDNIMSAELPGDKRVVISYYGPGYDTVGRVTDKFEDIEGYAVKVAGENISGKLYLEENTWDTLDAGDEVVVYYNLQGVQGVAQN